MSTSPVRLTEASLIGANLSGADLRNARLVGARLDHARLVGADLSGADLTRARLSRADLTGVTVAGGRWTRAAVIDARGVPDVPELRAAAVAPGSRSRLSSRRRRSASGTATTPRPGGAPGLGLQPGRRHPGDRQRARRRPGLRHRDRRPVRSLQGHRGHVFAVSYGDGVLVTGSNDGTARLWDAATGRPLHVLDGHQDWPWPVVLARPGTCWPPGTAGACSGCGTWRVVRCVTSSLQGGHIVSMAFHRRLLATADQGGGVRLWDTATGTVATEFPVATNSSPR